MPRALKHGRKLLERAFNVWRFGVDSLFRVDVFLIRIFWISEFLDSKNNKNNQFTTTNLVRLQQQHHHWWAHSRPTRIISVHLLQCITTKHDYEIQITVHPLQQHVYECIVYQSMTTNASLRPRVLDQERTPDEREERKTQPPE